MIQMLEGFCTIVETMKLRIFPEKEEISMLDQLRYTYRESCNFVSAYIFKNNFKRGYCYLNDKLYKEIREKFGLKSQMAQSAIKTVIAKYDAVEEQYNQNPYCWKDAEEKWHYERKTLDWMQKQIWFCKPQADYVWGRDYTLRENDCISLNTLTGRIIVKYHVSDNYQHFFDGTWKFGTAKLVCKNKKWYLHIAVSKENPNQFSMDNLQHIVGVDRGIRFLSCTYDNAGRTFFISGGEMIRKINKYLNLRAELQARGTKSALRVLKRLSGRESRWMTDMNHCLSKTLIRKYGQNTLLVLENLTDVSTDKNNLNSRDAEGRHVLRSWPFYELGQMIIYKAAKAGAAVLMVDPDYTSQRCPKCGCIMKSNRKHKTHEYICAKCGYRSNDDRIAAMNIFELGVLFTQGIEKPSYNSNKNRSSADKNVSDPERACPAANGRSQPSDDAATRMLKRVPQGVPPGINCTCDESCNTLNLLDLGVITNPVPLGAG